MTISYNWLSEYLPERIEPSVLSNILTSVGLEVETLEKYEEVKGGLAGLVIGEVLEVTKHPEADKLSLTKVDIGAETLQIVCGAANVAVGQKVVVAPIGATIYPVAGGEMTMKKAKIRGQESFGMICAEDEIGIGHSHAGIMVLPNESITGSAASEYFKPYSDYVFEIGLTPNRMDAMSHLGVAKDVCAYLSHHHKKALQPKLPFTNNVKPDNKSLEISVDVQNAKACSRYAGVSISGITVKQSPIWLQQKLKAIGVRPINNIVDITNYILHETGQPLHAFDAAAVKGKIIVKNLKEGTPFITLDEKERKLNAEDLMICNAREEPMCFGGVFGGLHSGVSDSTTNIFLESAWFEPVTIRRTSVRHGLRTDAATRFEKGVDISKTVTVLKRAALMIKEIAGGLISSDIVDVYPQPKEKAQVTLKNHYLKKLSGKNYHPDTVKNILESLGFEMIKQGLDDILVAVPFSNPDIKIPADIIEEIMRIDGLDNVDIPSVIPIAPAIETLGYELSLKEKVSQYLSAAGLAEILTNSITNSAYYNEEELQTTVKIMNSLSVELDVMKPAMLQTGLECIAYNLNRKNNDLSLYEFGKTYSVLENKYNESEHLCLYICGNKNETGWKEKSAKSDIFFLKGLCQNIFSIAGLSNITYSLASNLKSEIRNLKSLSAFSGKKELATLGSVSKATLDTFHIKQGVFYADINWQSIIDLSRSRKVTYEEIPKFPAVHRDLSIIIDKAIPFSKVIEATDKARVDKLTDTRLFDVFESEKLGQGKKSLAISFTFLDKEKTLTDKEIDNMVNRIATLYEKELNAEIRKG
jgi:phenylalanyl-tRNA synthetase beta chain